MLESIHFKNFKALRDATLPLGRFTLLVGPNGSGKSSVIQAIQAVRDSKLDFKSVLSAGVVAPEHIAVQMSWTQFASPSAVLNSTFKQDGRGVRKLPLAEVHMLSPDASAKIGYQVDAIRSYAFDAVAIATPVELMPEMELGTNGFGLAGVLDVLRDLFPERFDELNVQLQQWLPEFNRVLFETPQQGKRALLLRTTEGGHAIPARELSQGTLVALAILTLNYLPDPPSIVCIEELDRGVHPRLLRNILDALYRLCYPEEHGETRPPVQVIATTHSPYLLDLFKDHPEEVVIVQKTGLNTEFKRLSDHPHLKEIIDEASLGEVWYTGILGGVPVAP